MAKYDKALADFVKAHGEDAVESAFKAFLDKKTRSKKYADGRKQKNALVSAISEKAKDPAVAEALRKLGITV